jgi:hypothetical protein
LILSATFSVLVPFKGYNTREGGIPMKKTLSISLAVALACSAVPAAFADTVSVDAHVKASVGEKGNDKKNQEDKIGQTTPGETAESNDAATAQAATESNVKDAVKLKKELIELRQQLKHRKEVSAELIAAYEKLVDTLEKASDLSQAIEVQKELLARTYQPGDRTAFKKLGKLYAKAKVSGIKAFVNGEEPAIDQAPFIQGGRALVPVRAISSALKADVKWDAATRTVLITRGERTITLYLDKKEALVNGDAVTLDIVPVIKKGRVFLPLRFVSEQLNSKVEWQQEGQIIIIEDQEQQTSTDSDETSVGTETSTNADANASAETNAGTGTDTTAESNTTAETNTSATVTP